MIRVYLNSLDDDRMWSVDSGPGTKEVKAHAVNITKPAVTREDVWKRGSKTEPCCWLEVNAIGFRHDYISHGHGCASREEIHI